jgi:3-isopropylmalate/(R)-2-methylmalate dehydratase large subunit
MERLIQAMPKTMFEKIWEKHVVQEEEGKPSLLYIDLHLIHEVTSPQAFEGLRLAERKVRRPDLVLAVADHDVPTTPRDTEVVIEDPIAKQQLDTLNDNTRDFGIELFDMYSPEQGIVHVIGPEMGATQPGMTIVCGDSHTATHGAFGALAFGIGTSEVEHVLATQCLMQARPKTMEVRVSGDLQAGVTAKDLILSIIHQIGVAGGVGHVIEYTGQAIRDLSMEARMTVCNMSIEGGARAGMIAPDEKTFDYLRGRKKVPHGAAYDEAVEGWKQFTTDEGAEFDAIVEIDASAIEPRVTWGTNPGQVAEITGNVPSPEDFESPDEQENAARALDYMGLTAGQRVTDIKTRPGIHRLLHQRQDRGHSGRRRDRKGPQSSAGRSRHGGAWLNAYEENGGGRRTGSDPDRRRFRVADGRVFHVPGNEPGHPRTRRALRFNIQP